MHNVVLILGPTGRVGRHAAAAFETAGWEVRRFDRRKDRLWDAAWGASVIVNGWNPSYHHWARDLPGLTRQVIEVAKASGATVIVPGNLYGYGADAPECLGPKTPMRATNPLGRLRIDMERAYRDAGIRTIVVRAGDFIDTAPSGNWFDRVIAKHASAGRIAYPGAPDCVHAWAYLPDVARVMVALAEQRHALDPWVDIPVPGYAVTGQELARGCAAALGHPVRLTRMSWLPLYLLRPVLPFIGGMFEMRYLWSKPHRLDPGALQSIAPQIEMTPLVTALRCALDHQIDPDKAMRPGGKTITTQKVG